MSSGGGGTTVQNNQPPEWAQKQSQENLRRATEIADKPYVQYTGRRVADGSPLTNHAKEMALNPAATDYGQGVGQSVLSQVGGMRPGDYGQDIARSVAGWTPGQSVGDFMNPYTDAVIDRSMARLGDARDEALRSVTGNAAASGAWGGSAEALARAKVGDDYMQQAGDLASNLYGQGYDKALAAAGQQQDRALSAAGQLTSSTSTANTDALGRVGAQLQAGQLIQQGSAQQNDEQLKRASLLSALGTDARNITQQFLDTQYADWLGEQNHDLNGLNILNSTLSGIPMGSTTTTSGGKTDNTGAVIGTVGTVAMAAAMAY